MFEHREPVLLEHIDPARFPAESVLTRVFAFEPRVDPEQGGTTEPIRTAQQQTQTQASAHRIGEQVDLVVVPGLE
jgi:hypothetical protein